MNGSRATHPSVAAYLTAVREELSDLPRDEVGEIADDVREHLELIAAEAGENLSIVVLIDRLGPPASYAAELRSAAGIPAREPQPESPPRGVGFGRRVLRFVVSAFAAGAVALIVAGLLGSAVEQEAVSLLYPALGCLIVAVAGGLLLVAGRAEPAAELRRLPGAGLFEAGERWVRAQRWGDPAIEVVGSLQPAWWIVRAGLVAGAVTYVTGTGAAGLVLLFVLAVVPSIWLGRRALVGGVRGWRRHGLSVANAGLAVGGAFTLVAIMGLPWTHSDGMVYLDGEPVGYEVYESGLYNRHGEPVTNLFPYGPDGKLLEQVRIVDQNGEPIDLGEGESCYDGAYSEESFTVMNPWGEHVFPRLTVQASDIGECQPPALEPPFGAQLPGVMETPEAVPTPEATPEAAEAVPAPETGPTPEGTPTPEAGLVPTPALPGS